ncbi:MAG: NAD-dependent epimerase/dehydratase family protein [Deltaproteobacteria bacterium]|nr:NAD-dependent epimerase/dehydratase family protein [Deltaproteobacteria bacterium]
MTILVTGAGGFLGGAVASLLTSKGYRVRQLRRRPAPVAVPASNEVVLGDLNDPSSLSSALAGVEAVIHCAGISGMWGDLNSFIETNAMGTSRLLESARRAKVKYFIYTSTPSVVHSGGSLEGVDESAPYSFDITQPYAYSKMLAERLVLEANNPDFKTLAIRPHLIWGPGDPHLLPRLAQRAVRGRLFLFSGGPFLVDATYIDNAALAHYLALEKLMNGAKVDGEAFFIAQGSPVDLNMLINQLLVAISVPRTRRRIPRSLGLKAAKLIEWFWRFFKIPGEPPVTVFTARQMSSSHWYDLTKAKRLLGYEAKVSIDEGLMRVAKHWADTH